MGISEGDSTNHQKGVAVGRGVTSRIGTYCGPQVGEEVGQSGHSQEQMHCGGKDVGVSEGGVVGMNDGWIEEGVSVEGSLVGMTEGDPWRVGIPVGAGTKIV